MKPTCSFDVKRFGLLQCAASPSTTLLAKIGCHTHANCDLLCMLRCRRYAAGSEAHILWSAETSSRGEPGAMVDRLNAVDLPTRDISAIEPAQVHTLAESCANEAVTVCV